VCPDWLSANASEWLTRPRCRVPSWGVVCVQATANFGLFARDIAQSRLRCCTYHLELDMRSSAMRDVLDEAQTEIVCRVHRH
jgi:hypothetical protein